MLDIDKLIEEHLPQFSTNNLQSKFVKWFIRKYMYIDEFNDYQKTYPHAYGYDFVEEVLGYLNFTYSLTEHTNKEHIPEKGRIVIVNNHPIAFLDALAIYSCVSQVRKDIKIVANELVMEFDPVKEIILPVNTFYGGTKKSDLDAIEQHLENEGALIICPSGEVSRFSKKGIIDDRWHTGFIRYASASQAPILPIYIKAKYSLFFYLVSLLSRKLSTMFLINETSKLRGSKVELTIGGIISAEFYDQSELTFREKAALFKDHVYNLGKGKKPIFQSYQGVAFAENRIQLRNKIEQCEILHQIHDGKVIYLYKHDEQDSSCIIRELGRLREIAFRAAGEGTGKRRDIDLYDYKYEHIILWDPKELEIIGAYRVGLAGQLVNQKNKGGVYATELFIFAKTMFSYFEQGIEFGRCFIQPSYQKTRCLDYLWSGAGLYIAAKSNCRYLFGMVSIPSNYPRKAKDLLVYFYSYYFYDDSKLAKHKQPYDLSESAIQEAEKIFSGSNYNQDYFALKQALFSLGVKVPILLKQYSLLCSQSGTKFIDFGVDSNFSNCVDGLLMIDLNYANPRKYNRYIGRHLDKANQSSSIKDVVN